MTHITAKDVLEATERIKGSIVRHTPLLESTELNTLAGCRVLVKAECLQRPGSFKVRGATNRILRLPSDSQKQGVVAFSSGNFGRGLAAAAQNAGVPCTIVMPADAPDVKKKGATGFGATLLESPIIPGENREVTAAALAQRTSETTGATLLHPFEDADVIAGQGSLAVEVHSDTQRAGITVDVMLIPAGGGGLSAGCNLIKTELMRGVRSYIVEPEHYADHAASFAAGARMRNAGNAPTTHCDALQAVSPGQNTWPINYRHCEGGLTVSDAEVHHAVDTARSTLGLALEPSGACALAALLSDKVPGAVANRVVVVVASGGDPSIMPSTQASVIGGAKL